MIRKVFLYLFELIVVSAALFALGSAIPGHAYSLQPEILIENPSGLNLEFAHEYALSPLSPDRLESVTLTLNSSAPANPDLKVRISFDHGNTWHKCSQTSERIWQCLFAPEIAPLVEHIYQLDIQIL
jgi:hypothetical protein